MVYYTFRHWDFEHRWQRDYSSLRKSLVFIARVGLPYDTRGGYGAAIDKHEYLGVRARDLYYV